MAERTCSVDGCDRPTGIRGTARGWCRLHYGRWQRHGDPLREPKRGRNHCTIDGCDQVVEGHGLCSKHYTRQKRYGTTGPTKPYIDLPDGLKWCSRCQQALPVVEFSGEQYTRCRTCSRDGRREWLARNREAENRRNRARYAADPERYRAAARARREANREKSREYAREYRKANPDKVRESFRSWCVRNPDYFANWRDANRDRLRDYGARRRARKYGAGFIPFSPEDLERRLSMFGFMCWMCRVRPFEHVDHVKPLAAGGPHCLSNLRPSCAECNFRKGSVWPLPTELGAA